MKFFGNVVSGWVFVVLLSGCAGPLLHHESARSLGKGNNQFAAGSTQDGYMLLKLGFALGEDADVYFQWEPLNLGLRVKWAPINNQKSGMSFSVAPGYGATFGGHYWSMDANVSYLSGIFEPYFTYRYVDVEVDGAELRDEASGEVFAKIPGLGFTYGQLFAGVKFWIKPDKIALSFEGTQLSAISEELEFEDNVLVSGALDLRF